MLTGCQMYYAIYIGRDKTQIHRGTEQQQQRTREANQIKLLQLANGR